MITLEQIQTKHLYTFPPLFATLFNEGMLDWMRGFQSPLAKDKTWAKDVYPSLREHPPLFLHSGGSDFELLQAQEILDFEIPPLWDSKTHHFIPFAKTQEGNIYAFYQNIEIEGENPIVLIWDDMNETEIIAKNFEDFIFRKMLEISDDISKDDIKSDYPQSSIEGFRKDLLLDVKSISPYLNPDYIKVLEDVYQKPSMDMLFSYGFTSSEEVRNLIKKHLDFEYLDKVIEHEI